MNYQNLKGVISVIIWVAVVITAVSLVDYLFRINERISRLEQAIAVSASNPAETANGDSTSAQEATDEIAAGKEPTEKVIVPDDSIMVSGEVTKVEKDAITIAMMPDNKNYDFVALVNESTSVNKQKDAADQNAVPAKFPK